MKVQSLEEFRADLKAQGVPKEDLAFICPRCKTVQSARDLMKAADWTFEMIEKYLAFSCIGRFDSSKGCDWTLGGLFQFHELEVVTEDGEHYPRFEVASPAMAQAHKETA